MSVSKVSEQKEYSVFLNAAPQEPDSHDILPKGLHMEPAKNITASVIVLTYNHEKYVAKALDSILAQKTDFPFEILVGDDASADSTPEILQNYQRRYPDIIRLFLHKTNGGATANAYPLFFEAKGDYIATCEGDDFWLTENKLQQQVAFLEAHPEYIGCSHPCIVVDQDGTPTGKQGVSWECEKKVMTIHDFKGIFLPGQTATLVRRNIYKTESQIDFSFFYKASKHIGDRTTGLIYLTLGDFYRFDTPMSAYRVISSDASITTKQYRNNREWFMQDYEYTRKLMHFAWHELHAPVDFSYQLRELLHFVKQDLLKQPSLRTLKWFCRLSWDYCKSIIVAKKPM